MITYSYEFGARDHLWWIHQRGVLFSYRTKQHRTTRHVAIFPVYLPCLLSFIGNVFFGSLSPLCKMMLQMLSTKTPSILTTKEWIHGPSVRLITRSSESWRMNQQHGFLPKDQNLNGSQRWYLKRPSTTSCNFPSSLGLPCRLLF